VFRRRATRFLHCLILAVYSITLLAVPAATQAAPSLPNGYSLTPVADGLNYPTNTAWLPDGTMLISEKAGTVRTVRGGTLQPTPVIDISSSTNDFWDRGLIGLAVDPQFTSNRYIYLMRTYENNAADYAGTKSGQLVRVTLNADATAMVPGSLTVILGKSTPASCEDVAVTADCLPADSASHTVGDVMFAPDGTIFATTGDGANFHEVDARSLRSQNLDSLAGKLLHVDRNGKGIAGNPFYTGNADDNRSKVYSYGLRNPWRITFKPGTSTPYLVDVGSDLWEEVNVMTPGSNYGWPCYEGGESQDRYEILTACQQLINRVNTGAATVKNALVSWHHEGQDAAVVGGTFVTGNKYPAELLGTYIYGDYANQFLRTIRVNDANQLTAGPTGFGAGMPSQVNIEQGPDGYLYLVSIADDTNNPGTGRILRLDYTDGSTPPPPPPPPTGDCPAGQYQAQYFNNKTLTSTAAVTRCEAAPLDHDWLFASPAAGVNAENFSARYTGTFAFEAGTYSMEAWADDGIRVFVDGQLAVNGWFDQAVSRYQANVPMTAGNHTITVEYYDAGEEAVAKFNWTKQGTPPPPPPPPADGCPAGQYTAEFFNTMTPGGAPVLTRCETGPISHDWGYGAPGAGVNTDKFSARYTGTFDFAAGEYKFEASGDDGVRAFVDSTQVINGWQDQGETAYTGTRTLTAGPHTVTWEFYDNTEDAIFRANWTSTSTNLPPTATVLAPSDNAEIEIGSTVNFEGYATDIEDGALPAANLRWSAVVQHCASGSCHSHFLQQWNGTGTGSFAFPDHGQDEYYVELSLTATDSAGSQTIKKIRLNPKRTPAGTCAAGQFKADYFNNKTLTGTPAGTACTALVNYDWLLAAPGSGITSDNFSARFVATKTFEAGTYTFKATGDDGVRLYIDGVLVIDGWKDQAATTYEANRTLTAGNHEVKLEFYDALEEAVAKLEWTKL
jgi:glucose/arabinose dehydrogenase